MDEVLRFDSLAVHSGDNLTSPLAQLEVRVAALESSGLPGRGASGLAFNSGRAALDALARLLRPEDRVLLSNEIGGVAARNFAALAEFDVTVEFTDFSDLTRVNFENSSLVFLEAPSSATLRAPDLSRIARAAHEAGGLLVVDNSLLTAYGCRPLEFGADAVVYSNAAGLTGDSSLALGMIVTRSDELLDRLKLHRDNIGARPNAQSSGSALRGIKTLGMRSEKQFAAADDLARHAERFESVRSVHYSILQNKTLQNNALQDSGLTEVQQLTRDGREVGGATFALALWNSDATRVFLERLRVFTPSEWAGGADSTVCQPARSSHRALGDFDLALPETLIRLSVGLEDPRDLKAALEVALNAIAEFTPAPEPIEPDVPENAPEALQIAAPDFLDALDDAALERFARLRAWRDDAAREQGISKLLVLSNALLQVIATDNPDGLEGLGGVKGVGPRKLERYGEALLNVLKAPPQGWTETLELGGLNTPKDLKPRVSKPEPAPSASGKKRRRRRRKPVTGAATT